MNRKRSALREFAGDALIETLIVFGVGAIVFLFGWILAGGLDDSGEFSCPESVLVQPGDTLDSIARTNCTGDVRTAIRLLVDFHGTTIYPGQRLEMPASPQARGG